MSSLDCDGSENPFEIDVDAALREFGTPVTAPPVVPGEASADLIDGGPDGTETAGPSATEDDVEERPDGDLPADETLSSGSSDPDVIHIDLTQRPPPLPMSGMSLEQIVSMLPGSTYAVSGSGVPIRSSPRSEPLQQSPSAKTSSKPRAADTATASADGGKGAEPDHDLDAEVGIDEQAPSAHGSGGQGAGSSPGSPQVALTYIPGLGLVPVVIHDALGEDEEDEDVASGFASSDDGNGGVKQAAPAADGPANPLSGEPPFGTKYVGPAGAAAGASPGVADRSSQRLDISEGQLKDIIQQAIQGLDFRDTVSEEGFPEEEAEEEEEVDGDYDEYWFGSQHSDDVDHDSPKLQAVFERPFSSGTGRSAAAAGNDEAEAELGPSATRLLLEAFERSGSAQHPEAAGSSSPESVGAGLITGAAAVHELDTDEYDENLIKEDGSENSDEEDRETAAYEDVGSDILDEVDDSGSGGGDEPEIMLGGLGHARMGVGMGFPADGAFLGIHDTVAAPVMGQYTSTTIEAGIHPLGAAGTNGRTMARDAAPQTVAAAAKGDVEEPYFTVRVSDSSSAAGLHLPRPRYLSHNPSRSCDPSYGAAGDDSAGRGGAAGQSATTRASERVARSPEGPSSDAASTGGSDGGRASTRGSSGGADLNSTLRTTGQSLAAIRQAALHAEAQRQAKSMAERLGGGGDKGPRATAAPAHDRHRLPHLTEGRGDKGVVAASINKNPFGSAQHEASSAAGLIDTGRGRGGSGGSERMDGRQGHRRADGDARGAAWQSSDDDDDDDDVPGVDKYEHDEVFTDEPEADKYEDILADIMRDRNIIQPRYPTDTRKGSQQDHHEGQEGGQGHGRVPSQQQRRGGDMSMTMESDGLHGWRPRHRRSVDVGDLGDMLAQEEGGAGMGEEQQLPTRAGGGARSRSSSSSSSDGISPPTSPNGRSLLATRKSDDGQLAPPLASSSPRLHGDDSGSEGGSLLSSSAQSVADERLVDELEALREELGQKTTLVAGLRGELRKYTDLAMRLEHQLSELRSQAGGDPRARNRTQSEAGTLGTGAAAAALANTASNGLGLECVQREAAAAAIGGGAGAARQAKHDLASPPSPAGTASSAGQEGVTAHALPPHPQAQGLEGPARLTLYREVLSQAQMQVGRCGGPAPPDLRDAQELLRGKDILDAGTEKVMLIKLQKMVAWGCEAAWKASAAAQQIKFAEHAAQQAAAAARAGWEVEREQLRQALEDARSSSGATTPSPRASDDAGGDGGDGTSEAESELRRQLQAAQDEAAVARGQAAEMEEAVASLNADVRKLKVQLRNSRDGAMEHAHSQASAGSEAAGGTDAAGGADSRAWAMERKMLLSTIAALNQDLEQARTAAAAAQPAEDGLDDPADRSDEANLKKLALAEAALERVAQLQAERDTAVEEGAKLRRQLEGAGAGVPGRRELDRLKEELAAAREELEIREAAADEAVEALQTQVVQLRQELAVASADVTAAAGWREDDRRALRAEQEAGVRREAAIQELQQQLLACEGERDELKAAVSREVGEKHGLEEKLRQAREALASALLAAQKAHEDAAAAAVGPLECDATAAPFDVEEALRVKSSECEHLQRLAEVRTHELALAESQLGDVHAAAAKLQTEAAETQARMAELTALLAGAQRDREAAESAMAAARAAAAAAGERAGDAHAASLLAEATLARADEEAEALRGRLSGLEEELEGARGRAEAAEVALAEVRAEAAELRATAAGLQAEARDLRTALSAEDSLQAQLRGQVECLENELEAQAALAQKRGEQAERMGVALAEAEHHRHAATAAASAADELREERVAAAAARQRAATLEARVDELHAQLAEAERRCGAARTVAPDSMDEEEQRHVEVGGQRVRTEPQLPDGVVAGLGPTLQHAAGGGGGGGGEGCGSDVSASAASVAALEERLRTAEREREALLEETSALRRQLEDAAARSAAASPPRVHEAAPAEQDGGEGEGVTALRVECARLLTECASLHEELEHAREGAAGEVGRRDAEALKSQLAAARAELQVTRAELQAASVELSVKAELMAAKDRSLATLQETVDALKLALQVTQQSMQPSAPSPRRSAVEAEAADGDESGDRELHLYRGSVAALQSKFADSESTIRRLEQQVAALETRLSTDDSLSVSPRISQALPADGRRSQPSQQQSPDAAASKQQLKEKDPENVRLLKELESTRGPTAAAATDLGHADSFPPHGPAGGSGGGGADDTSAAATINSLQLQLMQWRTMSEDLHARYQAKKDTVRRLREQLAAEQQRRADEQAQGQVQLEAASQRLGRLAADLATTLRRCIALDLQPLSATTLTTSPRVMLGGGVLPDDINSLAALLARQGAALIESLETALEHVNTAREERALVTAQLANRQAVLDELRHHLARQAVSGQGKADAAAIAAAAAAAGAAGRVSQVLAASPTADAMLGSGQATTPTAMAFDRGTAAASTAAEGTHSPGAALAAAAADASPHAAPSSSSPLSSPSAAWALHATAINLAQDMAALSAQQAGLRSTLQGFEQQRPGQARPRSLSAASAAYSPSAAAAAAGGSGFPLHSVMSYSAASPLRTRNISTAPDSLSSIPSGSPPHAYVGILSAGSRGEPSRTPLMGAASTGGGLHGGPAGLRHKIYGVYGAQSASSSSPEVFRPLEMLGRDAGGMAALRSPTRLSFLATPGSSGGAGSGGGLTGPGTLGLSTSGGAGMGLSRERERRLKLGETGL